jgi:hypothetical protein
VDHPSLNALITGLSTKNYIGDDHRIWKIYSCTRCGGVITAAAFQDQGDTIEIYPQAALVSDSIPVRARQYLQQALDTLNSPAGSVMLSASAIDAMLKAKGYKDGTLYSRIKKAAEEHMITESMAEWAHNVRLDANDQRHSDDAAPLPDSQDARRSIDFAMALAQFMFVLPEMVSKGLKETQKPKV